MDMTDAEIDWPELFGTASAFAGLAWEESRPGIWQAAGEPGEIAVAAVVPTGRSWFAAVVPAGIPPHQLAQMGFAMHDGLAERLRAAGWTVGCAGPDCEALWPCPKREMHDFMGQKNGGQLHTPIGRERAS